MSDDSKPSSDRYYGSSARAPSYTSSEHAASGSSQTSIVSPVAVNSSILSEPLSRIDVHRILGMEADSSSDSDSVPRVPWNMRAGTKNGGGNTLVTQSYKLATNSPHLTHLEWRQLRSEPRRQRRPPKEKGKRMHKSERATSFQMSRDFLLLIALCIGLACALVCLARPFITSVVA